eukprot:2538301-Rhodomonas_salina.1
MMWARGSGLAVTVPVTPGATGSHRDAAAGPAGGSRRWWSLAASLSVTARSLSVSLRLRIDSDSDSGPSRTDGDSGSTRTQTRTWRLKWKLGVLRIEFQ